MGIGGRQRGRFFALVAAGAVLASGAGVYGLRATDSWPFRASYCWGAWQEDSGPSFLGDEALGKSGSARRAAESAPPSPTRPSATCTVTVASSMPDDDSTEPLTFDERVILAYGPVPASAEERRAWIAHFFDGSASPLPDGLNGLVGGDRAMLVLPEACDVDGRPSAVTIRSESWGNGHLGKKAMPFTIGNRMDVARMLLAAAGTAASKAGCKPEKPLRLSSPMVVTAEKDERASTPLCRIPGVTFEFGKDSAYQQQVGAVGERLQTCSVVSRSRGVPDEPAAQFVMASEPRMVALFDGLPEGNGPGLVRATCDGRRTVFYGNVEPGLKGRSRPDDQQVFTNFTASVSRRIGCQAGENR
ncbi:hypothetical protein SSAG_00150 [Streptomyces sp. Mg1]|uniref:hypothetical protein n=1 Tax=Streptomyces TaxID=1883 RepID=UPI00017EA622|nr:MULTISPECIES: hypothetical protein [Streptomyces]AKL64330.1 hypothetical protein M444_01495 [Streptomyces sp. Mg1]EDX20359.1 hypothetical protein SSAG_00150 [Streptomyces sp. Mg1]RPK43412.1 hypothetical protein EES37_17175 [Streptomyces sp. ADI91-18]WSR96836.1 hypothetical protein OG224_01405 [Streptomyces goshikiensis]